MLENDLPHIIRGCIFKVYNNLGPGLLESACAAALQYEINKIGLNTRTEVGLPMIYELINVKIGYRLDMLVADKVRIEAKSVEPLLPVHHKQLTTYPKLAALKTGIVG